MTRWPRTEGVRQCYGECWLVDQDIAGGLTPGGRPPQQPNFKREPCSTFCSL